MCALWHLSFGGRSGRALRCTVAAPTVRPRAAAILLWNHDLFMEQEWLTILADHGVLCYQMGLSRSNSTDATTTPGVIETPRTETPRTETPDTETPRTERPDTERPHNADMVRMDLDDLMLRAEDDIADLPLFLVAAGLSRTTLAALVDGTGDQTGSHRTPKWTGLAVFSPRTETPAENEPLESVSTAMIQTIGEPAALQTWLDETVPAWLWTQVGQTHGLHA
ncbi:MAG: hypothetical protein J7M25_14045 [Deltaproteobacteria bacterium]|nr:hypothetical protein [Deltaproteobacteria bacterium]